MLAASRKRLAFPALIIIRLGAVHVMLLHRITTLILTTVADFAQCH
jgi:hypothetical protein